MPITTHQLVSSPACLWKWTLADVMAVYSRLGFSKFEAFTTHTSSALDINEPAENYLQLAMQHNMAFASMHLPPITDDFESSMMHAVATARYAQSLGVKVVLFKANSRENFIRGATPFLDQLDAENIEVTPVLQNHKGTPITTLEDFKAIITGINDSRMKTLLEVGHFMRVGVSWQQGYDLLGQSIALVHINDIDADGQSVPYGTGKVDFAGLFDHLTQINYKGDIVVELETDLKGEQSQRLIDELAEALAYLQSVGVQEVIS